MVPFKGQRAVNGENGLFSYLESHGEFNFEVLMYPPQSTVLDFPILNIGFYRLRPDFR